VNLSDSTISNFSYCNGTRRQIFLELATQLDERTEKLYEFYVAFFAIVDFLGEVKGGDEILKELRRFFWDARIGKEVNPTTKLEHLSYKFVKLLQERGIDKKMRYQAYWHLNKHLLNTIRYFKSENKLKSAEEIREYQQKEVAPWTDGLLVLLKPRLNIKIIEEIAQKCAYVIQVADDISDVYSDLQFGIVNFPKEDVLRYFSGLRISNDEVVETNPKALNVKMEYLVSQFDRVEVDFGDASKVLSKLRDSTKDKKTRAIIDALRALTYSFVDDARQVCYKKVIPSAFPSPRVYF
jgi:hypothetical protein